MTKLTSEIDVSSQNLININQASHLLSQFQPKFYRLKLRKIVTHFIKTVFVEQPLAAPGLLTLQLEIVWEARERLYD